MDIGVQSETVYHPFKSAHKILKVSKGSCTVLQWTPASTRNHKSKDSFRLETTLILCCQMSAGTNSITTREPSTLRWERSLGNWLYDSNNRSMVGLNDMQQKEWRSCSTRAQSWRSLGSPWRVLTTRSAGVSHIHECNCLPKLMIIRPVDGWCSPAHIIHGFLLEWLARVSSTVACVSICRQISSVLVRASPQVRASSKQNRKLPRSRIYFDWHGINTWEYHCWKHIKNLYQIDTRKSTFKHQTTKILPLEAWLLSLKVTVTMAKHASRKETHTISQHRA